MKIGMGFSLWICLLHTIIGLTSEVPAILKHLKNMEDRDSEEMKMYLEDRRLVEKIMEEVRLKES